MDNGPGAIIVSLEHATLRCADNTILPDINFQIRKGENWLVTGGSETAISTLFSVLAAKAPVIKGAVHFPFFDEYKSSSHNRDSLLSPGRLIAHVQSRHDFRDLSNTTQFYYQQRFNSSDSENSLTVRQYLFGRATGTSGTAWTVEKVTSDLKLQRLLDEQLIKLSNGETRRLLIAAALLRQPILLLLSNPLAGLDVASRSEVTELINHLAATGITVVMSSADSTIPATITHIGVFNLDNKLTVFARKDFLPAATTAISAAINEEEVKALLSSEPMPVFNVVVQMKNVNIRYGDRLILDSINWTIRQGERWALTGPNGAGKSTLLSLINGDNPQAFANDIMLFDRRKGSGESIWDIKKKTGFFSPELYQYFPLDTSCLQAVESGFYDTIGLFRKSSSVLSAIALQWLKLLGVGHVADKLLKQVSVAEQRLCLLARAFVKNPPLLILDEPCQGFNTIQQSVIKELLNTVCKLSNVTLIYVSHYQEDIPESVTKQITLKDGKRIEES